MTIANGIKLGWRLSRIALAAGYFSLASEYALALVNQEFSHHSRGDAEQYDMSLVSHPPAFRTFSPVNYPSQPLAIRKAKPKKQHHRLLIHNLCTKTVEIAVRYQDLQQRWTTQGDSLIPGKTSRYLTSPLSQTIGISNKLLYYYATSPDLDLVWSGSGSHQYVVGEQTLNMRIHYASVDVLDDYSLFILCAVDSDENL